MKKKKKETEESYKLFRKVKDLLHPSISKKNISDYKINVDENSLLLKVFYPKKVSNLKEVILYVPGEEKITKCEGIYSEIATTLSKELDRLVITIDYENAPKNLEDLQEKVYKTILFIYHELTKENIDPENISIMGDSTGANIVLNLIKRTNEESITFGHMILFYPVLSGEYNGRTKYRSILENTSVNYDLVGNLKEYYKNSKKDIFPLAKDEKIKYPKTLLLSGKVDPLVDEAKDFSEKNSEVQLQEIGFAYHGFLNTEDKEIIREYLKAIKKFMNIENNDEI